MRSPVHATDPITSHLAALHMLPDLNDRCLAVLRAVTAQPGRTSEEYAEALPWGVVEVRRRLSDLKAEGHVYRSGRAKYGSTSQSLWFPTAPLPGQIAMGL